MNRVLLAAVLTAVMMSALGCATVMVTAPPSSDVTLLTELAPAPSKVTYKNWYLLWGLIPLSTNSTADYIALHQLKEVRVKTYIGVLDWVINVITEGIIYTNTVEIEGNTK